MESIVSFSSSSSLRFHCNDYSLYFIFPFLSLIFFVFWISFAPVAKSPSLKAACYILENNFVISVDRLGPKRYGKSSTFIIFGKKQTIIKNGRKLLYPTTNWWMITNCNHPVKSRNCNFARISELGDVMSSTREILKLYIQLLSSRYEQEILRHPLLGTNVPSL